MYYGSTKTKTAGTLPKYTCDFLLRVESECKRWDKRKVIRGLEIEKRESKGGRERERERERERVCVCVRGGERKK